MSIERQRTSYSSLNEINGLVLDQEKEYFDLLNIHIKSLDQKEPIQIDFNSELHSFLHANLLKPFDTQSIKMKYLNVILEPRVVKILKICFWNILCGRFPETVDILVQEEVQKYYKKKLSRKYIKLLQSLPQPKDELLNYVIFTISYLIHFCFYKYFPPQREFFDFRFILNCYHTVLYEFNGILVSDIFVKNHIEKYFTNKFLDYEKKNMKELLQRQIELKKLNNKKFLGFYLNFPDISTSKDGSEFKDKIMTYLKKDKSKNLLTIDDRNSSNHQSSTHVERQIISYLLNLQIIISIYNNVYNKYLKMSVLICLLLFLNWFFNIKISGSYQLACQSNKKFLFRFNLQILIIIILYIEIDEIIFIQVRQIAVAIFQLIKLN
ncbi:hypothetical protein ABPG72_009956 [Tetrahymena utriculariae]